MAMLYAKTASDKDDCSKLQDIFLDRRVTVPGCEKEDYK